MKKWWIAIPVVIVIAAVVSRSEPEPTIADRGFTWRPDHGVMVVDEAKALAFATELGKAKGGVMKGGTANWLVNLAAELGDSKLDIASVPVDSIPFLYRMVRAALLGAMGAEVPLAADVATQLVELLRTAAIARGVPADALPLLLDKVDPQAPVGFQHLITEAYLGGAKGGPDEPLLFLIHDQASNPSQALKLLENVGSPLRVIAPSGGFEEGQGKRYFVDPKLSGDAYWAAMLAQADVLQDELAASLMKGPTPKPARIVVLGLGGNGPLATFLGLTMPMFVRRTFATGGAIPSTWVPEQLGDLPVDEYVTQNRKISYGAAVPIDTASAALAKSRKMDLELLVLNQPPSPAQVQKWLLPGLFEI